MIATCGKCSGGYRQPTWDDAGEPCGCEQYVCDMCDMFIDDNYIDATDQHYGDHYCESCFKPLEGE